MDKFHNIQNLLEIFFIFLFTFSFTFIVAPSFIRFLKKFSIRQKIRENAVDGKVSKIFSMLHKKKEGTPTMGGILIWGSVVLVALLSLLLPKINITQFSLINQKETYIPLFTLLSTAILGLVDDFWNIKGIGKTKGISVRPKMFWLTLFALVGALFFYFNLERSSIYIPIINIDINLGLFYIPFFIFVVVGTANAVNITDGLDGLAGGLLLMAFLVFVAITYTRGLYLLSSLCASICGALLSFLWFNVHPAKLFMGDTGSLSLGATLGVIAMITDSSLILPIVSFVFVVEAISVIIQIISKKLFSGKKVFKIAPLHHHYEAKKIPESLVVMKFWIVGVITGIIGLFVALLSIIDMS